MASGFVHTPRGSTAAVRRSPLMLDERWHTGLDSLECWRACAELDDIVVRLSQASSRGELTTEELLSREPEKHIADL